MKKNLVLISGLSGAGKSSASTILEDLGYHCIDQFPVLLANDLVELIENSNDIKYNNVALTVPIQDYKQFYKALDNSSIDFHTLLLVADDDTLLQRYKSTRRTHPCLLGNQASTLEESIAIDIETIKQIMGFNELVIDTTLLSYNILKKKIEEYFNIDKQASFSVTFLSFGYKNGVPIDADLMFDVRFLPNPYWEEELRKYSGDDKCVYDYIMEKEETKEYLVLLTQFLEYSLDKYKAEGKNHTTVAIGCTGGQHRSVALANYLHDKFLDKYKCLKHHRDKVNYDA